MTRNLVPCALLLLATSCLHKQAAPAKPKTHASVTPNTVLAPTSSALGCDATRAPELSDAALTAFVGRWRLAQKSRDFVAYSGLYAENFSGLSSSGASFVERQAWLRAHESSLALEPTLASAPAHIAISTRGAQVTFGPRPTSASSTPLPELFVISTAGGPKIAREVPARSTPSELSESPGLWLADEQFAFLSTAPDASWAVGAPSYAGKNSATKTVALARLPKALRAWLGRPVRVLGASGTVCETRLQRFAMRGQISPDLPLAVDPAGCADDHGPAPEAIARDVWRLSSIEGRSLVGEFSTPCKGALLAVDPGLPEPAIAAPQPAPPELGAAALTAFRQLPDYRRLQRRFKAENPDSEGAWEDRESRRGVWLLELPGRAPLLFVSIEVGSGCASFTASLSALWEVRARDTNALLTLLAVPSANDNKALTPRAVIDLGAGRGATLLLGPDGLYLTRSLLSKNGAGYRQTLLMSVPFFATPC